MQRRLRILSLLTLLALVVLSTMGGAAAYSSGGSGSDRLKRINHTVELPDRPEIRGIVARVPHLVTVEEVN